MGISRCEELCKLQSAALAGLVQTIMNEEFALIDRMSQGMSEPFPKLDMSLQDLAAWQTDLKLASDNFVKRRDIYIRITKTERLGVSSTENMFKNSRLVWENVSAFVMKVMTSIEVYASLRAKSKNGVDCASVFDQLSEILKSTLETGEHNWGTQVIGA